MNSEEVQNSSKRLYDKWFDRGLLYLCDGNSISYSACYFVEEMQMQGFNMVRSFQGAKTLSLPMQMLDADHVTAWSNGGATDISNCTMLCAAHNRTKGNK